MSRKQNRNIIVLLACGFAIRLVYLWQFSDSPLFYIPVGPDVQEYDQWARRIIVGEWLWREMPIHAPLYSYFLAGMYWCFDGHLALVRLAQLALNLLAGLPVYFVLAALPLVKRRVLWRIPDVFLALWALYPPLIYYQAELTSEALLVPLICCSVFFLYRSELSLNSRVKYAGIALAGLFTGLAVLTHPIALFFLVFESIYMFFRLFPRNWSRVSVFVVFLSFFLIVVAPVGYYNSTLSGRFAITQSNMGLNLYLGQAPNIDKNWLRPGPERDKLRETCESTCGKLKINADRYYLRKTAAAIREQPLTWCENLFLKALSIFHYDDYATSADLTPFRRFTPVLRWGRWTAIFFWTLAVTGLLLLSSLRRLLWEYRHFILLIAAFWLAQVVVLAGGRYRLGMMPGMMVCAAFTLTLLGRGIKTGNTRIALLAGLAASFLLVSFPFRDTNRIREDAEAASIMSEAFLKQERYKDAELMALKSLAGIPDWARMHNILGLAYENQEKLDKAAECYRAALRLEPDKYHAFMNLACLRIKTGENKSAKTYFKLALLKNSEAPDLLFNYALFLHKKSGDIPRAVWYYEKCLEYAPAHLQALNNLGCLLLRQEIDSRKAESLLGKALRLDSNNPERMINLAAAKLANHDKDGAERLARDVLRVEPNHQAAKKILEWSKSK